MPIKEDSNLSCEIMADSKQNLQSRPKGKHLKDELSKTDKVKRKRESVEVYDEFNTSLEVGETLSPKAAKKTRTSAPRIFPDIEKGHDPKLLVFTDVPDDVTIPMIEEELRNISGIVSLELLPSKIRNILVHTKSDGDAREILDKVPFTIGKQALSLVSWFDFCFEMMMKKVLKITNLPPDIDEGKLKEYCGYENEMAFVNYVPQKHHAFVFYESAYPAEMLLKKNKNEFLNNTIEVKRFRHSDFIQNIVFVFVNNLPKNVEVSDIRELFSTCGDVIKATFSEDKQTGRKRAVVYFNDKEEAERALELDSSEFLDEIIEVQSNCRKKEVYAVYVGNLHRGTRPIDLCYIFQDCGFIVNVVVPNQQKIVHRGEPAIVYFSKPSAVTLALNKHKKAKIRGVRIFVTEEKPSTEDSSRPIISRSKMYQRMGHKRRHRENDDYFQRQRVQV